MAKEHTGLGQQAGKLNLKIELYFCGLNLKYMRGGGPRRGYYVHYVFYKTGTKKIGGRKAGRQVAGVGDRRTDRQATDRQATSVYFEVLFRREGGGAGRGCIVLIIFGLQEG